jgi:methylase of polypeptide subunit release factors
MFEKFPACTYADAFDIILCNPPYILPDQYDALPPDVLRWESPLALVGDARRATMQYKYFQELCDHAHTLVKPQAQKSPAHGGPSLVFEVGLQGHVVADLFERSGKWEDVVLHLDYAKQPRWVSARKSAR